jgi:leucyl aminopeptidase
MFNISCNLNKKSQATLIFADKNLKFSNYLSYFSKNQLDQILQLKESFLKDSHAVGDLWEKGKGHKIIIFKIKERTNDYDCQKIGGLAYSALASFKDANIFFEGCSLVEKEFNSFSSNFFLGFYSKSYSFKNYKLKKDKKKEILQSLSVVTKKKDQITKSIKYAKSVYDGIEATRNLVTVPANILNPKKFVDEINKLKKTGLSIEILDEKKMKSLGMNALLGVGQGSANSSYLAIMRWNGDKSSKEKPVAFVGKGVCFDTGGISLKPARFMEDMKYDMGGAGTVTGLMKTLALRKAKVNVVGVVGLVENMVDGNAQRPGDVVISYAGQSIEVLNTDAEGRLVLADAIAYTEDRFKPKFIINLATLTGAIVVALGNEYAGLFSNNDKLAQQIYDTGIKDNEKAWRFPLHENFDRLMDSKIADLQNINYSGGAGSITAAQFLQRFIRHKTPWAHLDIAGMAWIKKDTEITPEGATGYGVKLLNRLIKEHYEK